MHWNKSTFIQSLLPPELQWGYTNQLDGRMAVIMDTKLSAGS